MKIKTITDKMWNELNIKPFISIGFHAHKSKLIAMAINDEEIYASQIIDDDHGARQSFLSKIRTRYAGSPIALSDRETGRFLGNLSEKKNEKCTMLKIVLKGSEEKLKNWESEIQNALCDQKTASFSVDNLIQCLDW
jgi:hypothetical protein